MTDATVADTEIAEEIREELRKACDMEDAVPSGIFDVCAGRPTDARENNTKHRKVLAFPVTQAHDDQELHPPKRQAENYGLARNG